MAAGESRKLFVGGIPSSAQETELRGHFARFGAVRSIVVMRDKESGHGRGFGFVEFEDEEAAAMALGDGERPKHFICGRLVSSLYLLLLERGRQRLEVDFSLWILTSIYELG